MYSNYGAYRNMKFTDIWKKAVDFLAEYKDCGLYSDNNKISDESAKTLFYLLYSRYGNSTIASSDINQFRYQVFEIIYEFGPTWEKRLEVQKILRDMTEEDLLTGGDAIYNHAYNPSTPPSTTSDQELTYINEQNVSKQKRAKLTAYAGLMELLKTDITSNFIAKFKKLFIQILQPEAPLFYDEEVDE